MSDRVGDPSAAGAGDVTPVRRLGGLLATIERGYAGWGSKRRSPGQLALAHVRMIRPTTRLWFDTLMPLSVVFATTGGQPPWRTALLLVATMNLLHLAATIVNDLQDRETDQLSSEVLRTARPIATGVISPRLAWREAAALAVLGVAAAFLVSWRIGIVVTVIAALTIQHELPPARTQARPVVSQTVGIAGLAVMVLTLVFAVGGEPAGEGLPFLVFVVVYVGLAEMLVKDIRDVDNDQAGGKQTTAVRYGAATTTGMAAVAYGLAAAAWLWLVSSYPGLRALPIAVGTAILVAWLAFTVTAWRRLSAEFSKSACVLLHRGSALVFACLCLCTIVAVR